MKPFFSKADKNNNSAMDLAEKSEIVSYNQDEEC
jgi:hypothetical protein